MLNLHIDHGAGPFLAKLDEEEKRPAKAEARAQAAFEHALRRAPRSPRARMETIPPAQQALARALGRHQRTLPVLRRERDKEAAIQAALRAS